MKRRDILVGAGGLVASALPLLGRTAPCPPPAITLDGGAPSNTACSTTSAQADWNNRTSGSGVVWHHNFDSAAEVNAFRWKGGVGNSPNSVSAYQANYVASGGADGGGYMQITRAAGTAEPADWWRPFSPMTGASNGRGVDDPGANGTLAPQTYIATQGGSQLSDWQGTAKPGWYGNAAYQNSFFDGTDFYLQMRVMVDPRRTQLAPGSYSNQMSGKLFYLTTTSNSNTAQEIVTMQAFVDPAVNTIGSPNYHNGYVHKNGNATEFGQAMTTPSPVGTSIQRTSDIPGTCDPYNGVHGGCWSYAVNGTWDTLLYHLQPGTDGAANTRLTVWAAHSGATSYTKIWDFTYAAPFEQGASSSGKPFRNGWNALLCSGYNNGFLGFSQPEFWQRFDQIIFSKLPIACPQV